MTPGERDMTIPAHPYGWDGTDRFARHESGDYRPINWQPGYDGALSWLSALR